MSLRQFKNVKIIYVGSLNKGETSLDRYNVFQKITKKCIGINIKEKKWTIFQRILFKIALKLRFYPDFNNVNKKVVHAVKNEAYDVIWFDKTLELTAQTLKKIKEIQPNIVTIHFNPDDPFGHFDKGWDTFKRAIPFYDGHLVSRYQNILEVKELGGKKIHYYDRSFSKERHRPINLNAEEAKKYECSVGFIGSYEINRAKFIAYLIQNGISVQIYGNGWENKTYWDVIKPYHTGHAVIGLEYAKAISGMSIALHFLRKANRDEQDSRTFEIPACRTFMLAERSPKHEEIFAENTEAVFFDEKEELLEKVNYYIKHPMKRDAIAKNGYQKSMTAGYDHESRLKLLLSKYI